MKLLGIAALVCGAMLLAACGAKPEKSIEKDCVRLGMFDEMNGADNKDANKKSCACLGGKLKESMSEKDLKAFAKTLKDSANKEEFDAKAQENGLSDASAMTFMGAAKSCALQ